jgi:hypothetical protein
MNHSVIDVLPSNPDLQNFVTYSKVTWPDDPHVTWTVSTEWARRTEYSLEEQDDLAFLVGSLTQW